MNNGKIGDADSVLADAVGMADITSELLSKSDRTNQAYRAESHFA